jgi:hypothetical protein
MSLMEIRLTVDLSDEDAAAIAKVKHTEPDDVAELEDYLDGYVEHAVELAHSEADGEVAASVTQVADSTAVFSETEVSDALNKACEDIIEAAQLPETGTRDALNLLVNAASVRLREPDQTLEGVAKQSYGEKLRTILEWITE